MSMSVYTHKPQRGYTLVELIVSVAIFSIVMLIAGAAFLTLISLDRQARATNDVVTNLSYVMDFVGRSVRTGTNYSSASNANQFSFIDSDGRNVTYRHEVNAATGFGRVEECIGSSCGALTDPRVDVESLRFYPRGTVRGDSEQPTVVFTIRGVVYPDARSAPVEFVIQSTATQRLIDL